MSYRKNIQGQRPVRSKKGIVRQGLIYRSWWVFLFLFLCFIVYSHAANKKKGVCLELEEHLAELYHQKGVLEEEQHDLKAQINSQSDPAWIQLTLMKGLGVVPEGQVKVYFHNEKEIK